LLGGRLFRLGVGASPQKPRALMISAESAGFGSAFSADACLSPMRPVSRVREGRAGRGRKRKNGRRGQRPGVFGARRSATVQADEVGGSERGAITLGRGGLLVTAVGALGILVVRLALKGGRTAGLADRRSIGRYCRASRCRDRKCTKITRVQEELEGRGEGTCKVRPSGNTLANGRGFWFQARPVPEVVRYQRCDKRRAVCRV